MSTKKEVIRFLISGTIIVLIDFNVYCFSIRFLSFSIAKMLSFTCAGIAGYAGNKYWTFKYVQRSYSEAVRYALINFLALGLNVLANKQALALWPGAIFFAFSLTSGLTALFTFVCFKWWVFKPRVKIKNIDSKQKTLKEMFLILWRSHRSPQEIACGVAVGVFIGITPLYGMHILLALLAALSLRRLNKLAIFLGLHVSLPPTIPFITWAGYSIGRMMVGSTYPVLALDEFRHFSLDSFSQFFYVLLLGSFVLGAVLSVVFYFLTLWVLGRRKSGVFLGEGSGK